jgi:hypothetical protein
MEGKTLRLTLSECSKCVGEVSYCSTEHSYVPRTAELTFPSPVTISFHQPSPTRVRTMKDSSWTRHSQALAEIIIIINRTLRGRVTERIEQSEGLHRVGFEPSRRLSTSSNLIRIVERSTRRSSVRDPLQAIIGH